MIDYYSDLSGTSYYEANLLMKAYHEFHRQGQACTVVAAGEIFFYSRRQVHYDQGWLTLDESVRLYLDEHISHKGEHQKITI